MRKEFLNLPFQIKSVDDDGHIEGYGAVFNNIDFGLDRIERGAFKDTLRARKATEPLPMLWQHNSGEPIGVWHTATEDKNGLYVEGQLNLSRDSGAADVPLAWQARALAKQRAVSGLSIGFYAEDYRYEEDVRVLTKLDVIEVSMATFPMNPLAQIANVKQLTNKEFVSVTRQRLGLSRQAAEALRADGLEGLRAYFSSRKSGDADNAIASLKSLIDTIKG